jgi:predicted DNA-binding protein (MmcQ/YjbR family)
MTDDPRLARLSEICLALPEATCERSGEHATFRVRKRVFSYYLENHHGDGIVAVCGKTALGENVEMAAADPARFYLPAYIGPKGWVALRLDLGDVDWDEVTALVEASYQLVAPRRLAARVGRSVERPAQTPGGER